MIRHNWVLRPGHGPYRAPRHPLPERNGEAEKGSEMPGEGVIPIRRWMGGPASSLRMPPVATLEKHP